VAATAGNPNAVSDARTAAALAVAGAQGALENVRINVRADDPAAGALLARADQLWAEARQRATGAGLTF
jgi:formiminotetrahydrofolate cyclodeaminase